jgi:hypothetical protein
LQLQRLLIQLLRTSSVRQVSSLGAIEYIESTEELTSKDIYFPDESIRYDHWQVAAHLDESVVQAQINKAKLSKGKIYKCEDSTHDPTDFFQFFPALVGVLKKDSQTLTYSGQCFEKIEFSMEYLPNVENPTSVKVHVNTSGKKTLFCKEHLFITTPLKHHLEDLFWSKKYEMTFQNMNKDDFSDIKTDGMVVYMFCHGVADTFVSIFNTMKLFIGGIGTDPNWPVIGSHVPAYMEKANVKFINETIKWNMKTRKTTNVWLTED